jgi:hypothetical protein
MPSIKLGRIALNIQINALETIAYDLSPGYGQSIDGDQTVVFSGNDVNQNFSGISIFNNTPGDIKYSLEIFDVDLIANENGTLTIPSKSGKFTSGFKINRIKLYAIQAGNIEVELFE